MFKTEWNCKLRIVVAGLATVVCLGLLSCIGTPAPTCLTGEAALPEALVGTYHLPQTLEAVNLRIRCDGTFDVDYNMCDSTIVAHGRVAAEGDVWTLVPANGESGFQFPVEGEFGFQFQAVVEVQLATTNAGGLTTRVNEQVLEWDGGRVCPQCEDVSGNGEHASVGTESCTCFRGVAGETLDDVPVCRAE